MSALKNLTIRTSKTKGPTFQSRLILQGLNQQVYDLRYDLPSIYPQLGENDIYLSLARAGTVWDNSPGDQAYWLAMNSTRGKGKRMM